VKHSQNCVTVTTFNIWNGTLSHVWQSRHLPYDTWHSQNCVTVTTFNTWNIHKIVWQSRHSTYDTWNIHRVVWQLRHLKRETFAGLCDSHDIYLPSSSIIVTRVRLISPKSTLLAGQGFFKITKNSLFLENSSWSRIGILRICLVAPGWNVCKWQNQRENELREPIPHIGLCTHHEPRSSIFKRDKINGKIIKTLKTQKLKMTKSVGEELHYWLLWTKTVIWCWKNALRIRGGIGIGNEFLKIARREEPLIGSGGKAPPLSHIILFQGIR